MSERTDRLRKKIADGQFISWIWIDLACPMSAEIIAGTGFDWILVDAEHNDLVGLEAAHTIFSWRKTKFKIGQAQDERPQRQT